MNYALAEKFVAPQGEGLYAGVPMAFLRFVGCSVGQKTCTACDTDFDRMRSDLGGGVHTLDGILAFAENHEHVCLTGGEPLDRDLSEMVDALVAAGHVVHVETSGTREPDWLESAIDRHADSFWLTVSPKPGYLAAMIALADEVKVIVGGLGDGPGWPTLEDAVQWADMGKLVYVQPRNHRLDVNPETMRDAVAAVALHPQLRLSVQLHKVIRTR